jgi:formylglycine-generating enzyme required for sulfatase activity
LTGIFLSYRREDAAGWTGRLAVDLGRAFPAHHVFQDIASIEIGEDFVEAMRRSLASCSVAIVVIGPRWLSAKDDAGNRRLDDPEDWVRLEVAESLQRPGLRVVPVLVGGAGMPKAIELPEPLKLLARRNAHEISDKRWDYDVGQLVTALQKIPALAGASTAAAPTETAPVAVEKKKAPGGAVPGSHEPMPGTVFRDGEDCPEMVVIPAGEFTMGSPESEEGRSADEGPQHKVRIARPFALGRYELTVAEFSRFVAATGYKTEAERNPGEGIAAWDDQKNEWAWSQGKSWRDPGFVQGDNHPVVGVSWNDAIAHIKWLSEKTRKAYRLASEAEWEYAARAGTTTARFWGEDPNQASRYANVADRQLKAKFPNWPWPVHDCDDGFAESAPVGSFEPNAFGLHDMIGNVWEWVQDCWNDSYKGAPADGRAWESGDCGRRVLRGGSWGGRPEDARAADRGRGGPGDRSLILGFRVARTL